MKKIKLTQGKFALVDDEDFDFLNQFKWRLSNSNYAVRWENLPGKSHNRLLQMHRVIMNTPKGLLVDHINHDTLDNRKENLRNCTPSENKYNSGKYRTGKMKYKGIAKHSLNRWKVQIKKDNVHYRAYGFTSEEDAARAYDQMAKELHGEFAVLNFPNE